MARLTEQFDGRVMRIGCHGPSMPLKAVVGFAYRRKPEEGLAYD